MLLIQRSVVSPIPLQGLKQGVVKLLPKLYRGGLYISKNPQNITRKDAFHSNDYQTGDFAYRLTLCFPQSQAKLFESLQIGVPRNSLATSSFFLSKIVPLTFAPRIKVSGLVIPENSVIDFLPFVSVYGGEMLSESDNLQLVYAGDIATAILEPHILREQTKQG